MTIRIEDLEFKTIIGLLDFERIEEQRVIINCSITYEYKKDFINYAEVAEMIESSIKEYKFELIEEALEFLFKHLKENFPLIKTLRLKLSKPDILSNCVVSLEDSQNFNET